MITIGTGVPDPTPRGFTFYSVYVAILQFIYENSFETSSTVFPVNNTI